jgi:hypothetical protein
MYDRHRYIFEYLIGSIILLITVTKMDERRKEDLNFSQVFLCITNVMIMLKNIQRGNNGAIKNSKSINIEI